MLPLARCRPRLRGDSAAGWRVVPLCYLADLVVILVFSTFAFTIPTAPAKADRRESDKQLEGEGLYRQAIVGSASGPIVNFTETVMLNDAAHAASGPVRRRAQPIAGVGTVSSVQVPLARYDKTASISSCISVISWVYCAFISDMVCFAMPCTRELRRLFAVREPLVRLDAKSLAIVASGNCKP